MRARQERERDIFSRVQRSMAYDQLPAAEQRLTRALENGDEEEIARATRALNRLRDEIDARIAVLAGSGAQGARVRAHILMFITTPRIRRLS